MIIIKPKGIIIKSYHHRPNVGTVVVARQKAENIRCPRCSESERLRKKSRIQRLVKHLRVLKESVSIEYNGHKYQCRNCNRYFNEQFPGLLPRRRFTEAFRREIFNLHDKGISQKQLSEMKGVSAASIERWYHHLLERKSREYQNAHYPTQLGMDEHRFTKKVGFVTTLCDLKTHKIMDIIKGRSAAQIIPKLMQIPGRKRVQMVNIDLSKTYRKVAKTVFPNATIVADRFHVIRLINQHMLATWQQLDPKAKYNRGLLSLMRSHLWNLTPTQQQALKSYLEQIDGLKPIYEFSQRLCSLLLLKKQTKRQCRKLIPELLDAIDQLKSSIFDPLVILGNTLDDWKEEIAAMWRFTKTNSITEGFHRRCKLIQRRAYGFSNFDNYRLRVRVLCGAFGKKNNLV